MGRRCYQVSIAMYFHNYITKKMLLCCLQAEVPAPSDSLEYTFARKGGSTGFMSGDDRQQAHFWEMGGHEEVALSLAKADHLFLTFKQVMGVHGLRVAGRCTCMRAAGCQRHHFAVPIMAGQAMHVSTPSLMHNVAQQSGRTPQCFACSVLQGLTWSAHIHIQVTSAVVVTCVDMTDPGSVLSNAEAWLGAIRSKLAVTYAVCARCSPVWSCLSGSTIICRLHCPTCTLCCGGRA